ncbi:Zn-dependent hydrolase [Brevibacillus marinus]|uniref:Zn-dependent hydrolase n=1 Tax=Brevibacillus marinus TaxID=2496837 RepID=UPI0013DF4F6C|nr:Zn-dependent hydrolase [Brevibacillus marinus]
MAPLQINIERLKQNLLEVASLANAGSRGYTRTAFSAEEKRALEWLKQKLAALSVRVSQDAVGNVFGKWGNPDEPSILFGSHLDTVPEGGLFDGALGVVAGLECLQTLREHGYQPNVPLELVCFVGEEANPLGGTFGSRAVAGLIPYSAELEKKLNEQQFTWDDLVRAKRTSRDFRCFLELHIEQGSLLEAADKQIGIVTAIAGILRLAVRVNGRASHSGTTPMHLRRDALVDAAALIQKVNQLAKETNSDIVATVGEIAIFPNLANVVPGEAHLTIEVRGSKWEEMKAIEEAIREWSSRHIAADFAITVEKRPNSLSAPMQSCVEQACRDVGASYQYMVSGANHDANSLTALTDVGMIFVPSKDGISHHPDEWTSWEDIETGANVMLQTILRLADRYSRD